MTQTQQTPSRPTAFMDETPQDGARGADARLSKRINISVGVIVVIALGVGVLLALRFFLRQR